MPPIPQLVAQAWRDLAAVVGQLPRIAGIAFLIMIATDVVGSAIIAEAGPLMTRRLLLTFVFECIRGFLLTPYLIAVHRFIVLNETSTNYTFAPGDPRFQRFFTCLMAMQVVSTLPALFTFWATQAAGSRPWLLLVFTLAVIAAVLRLAVIFPAIAVNAPGATFQNAVADTKGHVWRIVAVNVLVMTSVFLPVAVAAILVKSNGAIALTPMGIVNAVVGSALGLALLTLLVAVASRFYLLLGQRLKSP